MNIRILINLLLVATLAVISINASDNGKKRRAADDSNLDPKKIKLDPAFLAELAKAKVLVEKSKEDKSKEKAQDPAQKDLLAKIEAGDEKVIINLDATKLPIELKELIADYFKGEDWYLYYRLDLNRDGGLQKIYFSNDNNLILFGGIVVDEDGGRNRKEMLVFNISKKCLEKEFNFNSRFIGEFDSEKLFRGLRVEEDEEKEKYNIIDLDNKEYSFDKTYFSIDDYYYLFEVSFNKKYLAYACVDFLKIWDISKIAKTGGELNESNIITTYNLNPNNDNRRPWFNSAIHKLSFSNNSEYVAINGTYFQDPGKPICFICNLTNTLIFDFSTMVCLDEVGWGLKFSHDDKYMVLGGIGRLYIFKKRQLVLEE